MYKWPATFAGYRAVLTVQEEECLWHGEATVQPQQAVDVQLDSDASVRAWVHESLSTQAMHLADIPFAQGDGRYVLTFDPQETGTGRLRVASVSSCTAGAWLPGTALKSSAIARLGVLHRIAYGGSTPSNVTKPPLMGAYMRRTISWHTSQPTVPAWSESPAMLMSLLNTSPPSSYRPSGRSGMSKADAPEHASSHCRPIECWDKSS